MTIDFLSLLKIYRTCCVYLRSAASILDSPIEQRQCVISLECLVFSKFPIASHWIQFLYTASRYDYLQYKRRQIGPTRTVCRWLHCNCANMQKANYACVPAYSVKTTTQLLDANIFPEPTCLVLLCTCSNVMSIPWQMNFRHVTLFNYLATINACSVSVRQFRYYSYQYCCIIYLINYI